MNNIAEFWLSPRAQRDLDGTFDYKMRQWGLAQAPRYARLIEAACASLAEAPQHSQDYASIRPGYQRRRAESHFHYLRRTSYGIAVIRILRQRMDQNRHF